jgi:hypothetical protein
MLTAIFVLGEASARAEGIVVSGTMCGTFDNANAQYTSGNCPGSTNTQATLLGLTYTSGPAFSIPGGSGTIALGTISFNPAIAENPPGNELLDYSNSTFTIKMMLTSPTTGTIEQTVRISFSLFGDQLLLRPDPLTPIVLPDGTILSFQIEPDDLSDAIAFTTNVMTQKNIYGTFEVRGVCTSCNAVPEPASLVLLATGLAGAAMAQTQSFNRIASALKRSVQPQTLFAKQ